MVSTYLRRTKDDGDKKTPFAKPLNYLIDGLLGQVGMGVLLRGFDGTRQNPLTGAVTSGHYALDVQGTAGLHAAFPLTATSPTAAPTVANSSVLIQDTGLFLGAARQLRIYATDGVDFAMLTSGSDGLLQVGGSGTDSANLEAQDLIATRNIKLTGTSARVIGDYSNAATGSRTLFQDINANANTFVGAVPSGSGTVAGFGAYSSPTPTTSSSALFFVIVGASDARIDSSLTGGGSYLPLTFYTSSTEQMRISTAGLVTLTQNLEFKSGTANAVTFDHAATSARTVTVQDLTGTMALLGVANAGGDLLFVEASNYTIGASGATRPATIYLKTSVDVAAGAQSLTATDVTLTAPWTTMSPSPALFQAGVPTSTVQWARYRIIGKTAFVQVKMTATSAGTAGNAIFVNTMPAALAPARTGADAVAGSFLITDASVATYAGTAVWFNSTSVQFWAHNQTAAVGAAPSFALANTDTIMFQLCYEIA